MKNRQFDRSKIRLPNTKTLLLAGDNAPPTLLFDLRQLFYKAAGVFIMRKNDFCRSQINGSRYFSD